MKKLLAGILTLSMVSGLAVMPGIASAEGTTYFKYENDFSTVDAPGAESTGAWDMENVGKWVTVETKVDGDNDQWSHDTVTAGPNGVADGVLRLGDAARPGLFFDTPITSGNVHVGFDFYYEALEGITRSNYMYSYYGFLKHYTGEVDAEGDRAVVSSETASGFDGALIKTMMTSTGAVGATPKYAVGGLGDANYSTTSTDLTYNKWMRADLVMENIESKDNMVAKWYIDGKLKYEAPVSWKREIQPLYGYVLQTSSNFNNECMLIDNLVIETYTGTKAVTVSADKKSLGAGQNSVKFTFSDNSAVSALTNENIIVTKNYAPYEGFTLTKNSSKAVTIGGLDEDGIYQVQFANSVFEISGQNSFIIPKGKISNFSYKQDFANSDITTWDAENIGKWFNNSTTAFSHDAEYIGADGKPGVMKLASGAIPAFVFDKVITDGTIHLSYKIKFDKSTKNYAYYYSGFANEVIMNNSSVDGNSIKMNYSRGKLIDTFMAGGMYGDTPYLAGGVPNSEQPEQAVTNINFDDWYKVDVIIAIGANLYLPVYYVNGKLVYCPGEQTALIDPFYAFIMNPFNMGTGNVYIDDLSIEHSYNIAAISGVDLSMPGKVKVTVPDASVNTTSVRKVIVAGYNQGQLVNTGMADFTLGRTMTSVDVDFDVTGCDELKVFVWNTTGDLEPLANVYTQSLN